MKASEFPSVRGARRQVERDFSFFRKMLAEYEAAESEKNGEFGLYGKGIEFHRRLFTIR